MRTILSLCIRSLRIVLAWSGIATAIAGCGSSARSQVAGAPKRSFQFSTCMRANGVPNFPDPGPHGFQFNPSSGMVQSPAFQGAMNTCQKYLPPSGHPPPIPESVRLEMFAFARCMRANGVPDFPDPGPNGIQFPVTSPIPKSPAYQRAQNGPCRKYLTR